MATMQDFSGLLFGGGGTGLESYITPEQQQAIQQQSMLQAASALLQAGGPSRQQISIGQALGGALQAGSQGYQQAQQGAIQNLLTRQKLAEAKRMEDLRKALQESQMQPQAQPMGEVTTITPDQAMAVGGLPAGPTVARANLIGQQVRAPAPQMSQQDMLYQDAMNKYMIADRSGYPEMAAKYLETAQKIKPMEKVSGAPFEVTDATTGKPIMVQQFDTGRLQTVGAYGPKRDVVLQSLGGKTVAIDKSKLAGGETYAQTLAPQVVGGAEAGGYFQIGGGGGGGVGGAPRPAGAPAPAGAPTGGAGTPQAAPTGMQPLTPIIPLQPKAPEAFMKASRQLNDLRGAIDDYKMELKSGVWVVPKNIPIPFTDSGIPMPIGQDSARVAGKYNSLLMGVKNLYELGALTGPDMAIIERQLTNPSSWTGLLTSKNAMNAQVKVLEDMLDRADKNLSSSYKQPMPAAATTQKVFTYNPATGQLEQK